MRLKKVIKRLILEIYEFVFDEDGRYYYCLVSRGYGIFDLKRYEQIFNTDPEIQVEDIPEEVWDKYNEYVSDPLFEIEYERFRNSF